MGVPGSSRSGEKTPKCFHSLEQGNLLDGGSVRGRCLRSREGWFCPLWWRRCKRGKVYLLVMQLLLDCNQVTVISAVFH